MSVEETPPQAAHGSSGIGRLAAAFKRVVSGRVSPAAPAAPEPPEPQPKPLAPDVARRIDIELNARSPEREEVSEVRAGFTKLAEGGLWPSLLDRLRGTDQSRQQLASGQRLHEAALAGALAPITRHLEGPAPKIDAALQALPVIEAVHAAHPRDYMPAVLLTRALSEIAWSIRGAQAPANVPSRAAAAAAPHFARAEAVLEAFDPIEQNSPMIAEARYRLAPGVTDGAEFLRDWYEDWADLDPANPTMLTTHSRWLMPDWYGDLDEVEREARRASKRAADSLGPGAYAMFWREPLLAGGAEALSRLDPREFLIGINNMLTATMSQDLANLWAVTLYRLSQAVSDPEGPELPTRAKETRAVLADGFAALIRRHLRVIETPFWPYEAEGIRAALASAFMEELADGATIRAGKRGLEAIKPSDAA